MDKAKKTGASAAVIVCICIANIVLGMLLNLDIVKNVHCVMLVMFAKTLMSVLFNALFVYFVVNFIILRLVIMSHARAVSVGIAAAAALLVPFVNTSYTCKIKSASVLPCSMLIMEAADILEEPVTITASGGRAYKSSFRLRRRGEYSNYFFEYTYKGKEYAMPVTLKFYNKAKGCGLSGREDISLLVYPHSGIVSDFAEITIGEWMLPTKAAEILKEGCGMPYALSCDDGRTIKITPNSSYKHNYFDNPAIKAECVAYYEQGMSDKKIKSQFKYSEDREYTALSFGDGAYYVVLTSGKANEVSNRLYYESENGVIRIAP